MSDKPYYSPDHLAALQRFAIAITALTILGHAVLGFEQSYVQPLVALATAYSVQLLLESVDAIARGRRPRFAGSIGRLVEFLLPAHITALAVAMLLYFNDRLWLVAFAAAASISSKHVFRAPVGSGTRHFFNPSNFGISVTLLLFPNDVGLVMPWQFSTNLSGALDWALPAAIFALGTYINGRFTRRLPLVISWLAVFAIQAVLRAMAFDLPMAAGLSPMTGIAFVLFTFYMAPDPATTPQEPWRQVVFGTSIAVVYGILVSLHIAFGLFFALTIVCALRGLSLWGVFLVGPSQVPTLAAEQSGS
jgi:Na+-translocating ferredoxin:NAD+ oxidoreductase RnfD subunit